jgi:hypothetical protein
MSRHWLRTARPALLALGALVGGLAAVSGAFRPGGVGGGSPPSADTLRVLFVGNSYTYYHDVPALVEAISRSVEGPRIRGGAFTAGGRTLRDHLADARLPGALRSGPEGAAGTAGGAGVGPGRGAGGWDRVVLQEQSLLGTEVVDPRTGRLGEPVGFVSAAEVLARMVREAGGEPVLYMTWARERFPGQVADLAAAYHRVGRRIGAPVAPVGIAWARARRERPELDLFQPDGSHPSAAGSYLAACVLYAALAGRSPAGAPARIRGGSWDGPTAWAKALHLLRLPRTVTLVSLEPEVAGYLQRLAWEVARAERTGPEGPR